MKILITGSSGLIGSEAVRHFANKGHTIIGVDNNLRKVFFGEEGDTSWNLQKLQELDADFIHTDIDIRHRDAILELYRQEKPDATIHCAAQPSHDLAAHLPFEDFDTNAVGTFNLLEACRRHCIDSPFIFMSTNKVYGDAPNKLALDEGALRYDYAEPEYIKGIPESFSIDQTKHSLFGASKVAADIVTQEYGRYFDMPTVCFRGGCLTGPAHSAVELHGFLVYIIKAAIEHIPYTVFGYKGKQVRDQIHSKDVIAAFDAYMSDPKAGAVYNLGGGKSNSASILEIIELLEKSYDLHLEYSISSKNRIGDHICYYSDLDLIQNDYPSWSITFSLVEIIDEIVQVCLKKEELLVPD